VQRTDIYNGKIKEGSVVNKVELRLNSPTFIAMCLPPLNRLLINIFIGCNEVKEFWLE